MTVKTTWKIPLVITDWSNDSSVVFLFDFTVKESLFQGHIFCRENLWLLYNMNRVHASYGWKCMCVCIIFEGGKIYNTLINHQRLVQLCNCKCEGWQWCTMRPKVCGHLNISSIFDCLTSHSKPIGINFCYNSPHSSWKALHYTLILNLAAGTCSHSATRALLRSNADVER